MSIAIIAAMTRAGRALGKDNQLLWHLPADLRHFKQKTLNKPIIMGRKTHESIGKALPLRQNIILTRQTNFAAAGCEVVDSLEMALNLTSSEPEVMVIGGATLYEQALPFAQTLYLTYVDANLEGDCFFPTWSEKEWQQVEQTFHPSDTENAYNLEFVTLCRRSAELDCGQPDREIFKK